MYGKIPDARNAVFDIWRTYEQDLTISDVAFYLRLNHSRLVTSTLKWRPDLKEDVTVSFVECYRAELQGKNLALESSLCRCIEKIQIFNNMSNRFAEYNKEYVQRSVRQRRQGRRVLEAVYKERDCQCNFGYLGRRAAGA